MILEELKSVSITSGEKLMILEDLKSVIITSVQKSLILSARCL